MLPIIPLVWSLTLLCTQPTVAQNITAIISANDELSTLRGLLGQYPAVVQALARINGTFFAPSNQALGRFIQAQGSVRNISGDIIQNLIAYHLLPSVYESASLRTAGGVVVETSLQNDTFTNLQGPGNVVFASAYGRAGLDAEAQNLAVYSGFGEPATVIEADLEYDGGIVHVIDNVLNLPRTCTQTAQASGSLSALLEAFRAANLWETVDTTPRLTCFAPTDEAFEQAGVNISSLSTEELVDILHYHTIVGDVGYSSALVDGQEYQTVHGSPVTVHKREGQLYINDIVVQEANLITTNGVAHLLGGILTIPSNETTDDTSTTTSGASPTSTSPNESAEPSETVDSGALTTSVTVMGSFVGVAITLTLMLA